MLNISILKEDESYTFRSYFEMPYEPDEILAQFGYRLEIGSGHGLLPLLHLKPQF